MPQNRTCLYGTLMSKTIKKPLGFSIATSLVVGNIIGSGIFLIPASLAAYGSISVFSWLFSTIGAILIAIVFSTLNRRIPHSGGAFLYAYHVYGEFIGFAVASSYWFSWCVGNASMAVALIGFLGYFWPALQEHNAHFNPFIVLLVKISVIWITTGINILGIRLVGKVQLITTILKILPLILIAIIGFFKIKWSYLTGYYNISHQSNFSAFAGGAALTLYAFIGLESAIVPADEITNSRIITKATIIGTVLCAIIYILDTVVLLGIFPATLLKNSTAPFSDAATYLFGPIGGLLIVVCAVISIIGCINGSILIQVQDATAAADHGLFPKIFSIRGRFNTATKGFIISAIVMTILLLFTAQEALLKQFNTLVLLTTLFMLIPYFISSTAELMLLLKNSEKFNLKRLILSSTISLLASGFSFLMMMGSGKEAITAGCLLFFALFWFYWLLKFFNRKNKNVDLELIHTNDTQKLLHQEINKAIALEE